eukprot:gnl/TRDRNA2_/TRDRNA2_33221_c0_seq1.p2 gnl/TRDRNA2_/TRDRNA2_33221_c0~~gnl/TRDRNA2_/TRDRNA2_33221_c0_seq1.p2  ORF type:complete len:201 (+),score=7.18 gnl/TRDRNA2_/TRDRNA2_33221_c0_seq1:58-603(+)
MREAAFVLTCWGVVHGCFGAEPLVQHGKNTSTCSLLGSETMLLHVSSTLTAGSKWNCKPPTPVYPVGSCDALNNFTISAQLDASEDIIKVVNQTVPNINRLSVGIDRNGIVTSSYPLSWTGRPTEGELVTLLQSRKVAHASSPLMPSFRLIGPPTTKDSTRTYIFSRACPLEDLSDDSIWT